LTQVQGGMLAGSTNTTTTIQSNGTTAITIDSSQKVGIGTTTPTTNLQVRGAGSGTFGAYNDPLNVKGSDYTLLYVNGTNGVAATIYDYNSTNGWYVGTNNSAGYRIGYMSSIDQTGVSNAKDGSLGLTVTTAGRLLIGTTTSILTGGDNCVLAVQADLTSGNFGMAMNSTAGGQTAYINFIKQNTQMGYIYSTSGGGIIYLTSSDYRLKENIAPMTGALAKVAQLKPVTYRWKQSGEDAQGFIAHELQEVFPDAVGGEKDAVETYTDEDGNEQTKIKPQGIDTSVLVATLTAAIQELNAKVEAQAAEIAALKAAP
jgi:hypothetical protein